MSKPVSAKTIYRAEAGLFYVSPSSGPACAANASWLHTKIRTGSLRSRALNDGAGARQIPRHYGGAHPIYPERRGAAHPLRVAHDGDRICGPAAKEERGFPGRARQPLARGKVRSCSPRVSGRHPADQVRQDVCPAHEGEPRLSGWHDFAERHQPACDARNGGREEAGPKGETV